MKPKPKSNSFSATHDMVNKAISDLYRWWLPNNELLEEPK